MERDFRKEIRWNVGIIAGTLVAMSAVLWWLSTDITAQTARIVADRDLVARRSLQIAALADLKRLAPEAAAYQQAMDALLPTQDHLLDFPHFLDDLSKVRRLSTNFAFQGGQTAPQGNTPGYVGFTLDATGAPDDVVNFLKDIELQAPRFLVGIDTFDLTRGGTNYRALLSGRVFFK